MRLAELEEMIVEEPTEAEAAIAELVSSSNVGQLAHIARAGRVHRLKVRAIDALAEVGGAEAGAALIELLESANQPAVGGSEQKREQERLRARLVRSVARTKGVAPPSGVGHKEIAEFIESARGRE